MTKTELHLWLQSSVNHSREKRQQIANVILQEQGLVPNLLDIVLTVNDPISCKAAWVLEFAFKENNSIIFPVIDKFLNGLKLLTIESSIRPCAKICEILMLQYFSKQKNQVQKNLKEKHLELITTVCFDWLIGNHKVATQAYSMTSLYALGKKYAWIHPELRSILEKNYPYGTAAYKARARLTLDKIA
ncbi:adenylosuccinate lyase [Cellulophaga lytica]|uniref:adenylosuccinate lyase n=1 Tax=Cellulophaga lytica TaxID=979 RepID=UPI0009504623|nr:adenylosuccinate lyase [Cellulophaga lytica]APU08861.1 adenylosuccinate lyase [Cellulophaga lytica]